MAKGEGKGGDFLVYALVSAIMGVGCGFCGGRYMYKMDVVDEDLQRKVDAAAAYQAACGPN
jgi:hypothetical protein